MWSTGSSFENRRSRISCSSTCDGAGLHPPLFRLIIVRSRSKARWIDLGPVRLVVRNRPRRPHSTHPLGTEQPGEGVAAHDGRCDAGAE
jgi:hypothetical protein